MIRLSACADQFSADLIEQLYALRSEGIRWVELRSVWDADVLDLSDDQVEEIKDAIDDQGFGVSAIGSPVGKVPIDQPFAEQLARLRRAITLAYTFDTPYIRIFSFYPPAGEEGATLDPEVYRDEVLARVTQMAEVAGTAGITLLHENEEGTYGDTIERCADLLTNSRSTHLQALLNPANFIQVGQKPYPDAYLALRTRVRYLRVTDALPDGTRVTAGEGAALWPDQLSALQMDGYSGFFSLAPHLTAAGQYKGLRSPEFFRQASHAFQQLLRKIDWVPEE